MLTISKAAKILGVSKKTLLRWDASGKFLAQREPNSGNRYYDEQDIKNHAAWFTLRKKHRAHNRKLTAIRKEADKFLAISPLNPFEKPNFFDGKKMKAAYDSLNKWEDEDKEIMKEYGNLPLHFRPKIDLEK